jgi:DNA polymerase III subunit delta'
MFDKLIGNERIKDILKRLIQTRRVPNSLLFTGAEGVGKKQFALETARAILCQNPREGEACDSCGSCTRTQKFVFPKHDDKDRFKKIVSSEHPDLGIVIPRGNSIFVDAIRDLEREANFRPFESKARIFIIDDAHKLNSSQDNAANALLKALEEPAPTSHIFLVTSRPATLLPTIRSRCQSLQFAPVPAKQIEGWLERQKQMSPAEAEIISRFARGSVSRALHMDLEQFRDQRESMLKVLESVTVTPDRAALLRVAEEMNAEKTKDQYDARLEILETLIRDAWSLRLGDTNIVNIDLLPLLERSAASCTAGRIGSWLTEIENLRRSFAVNINRKIATDALFMQMVG